VTEQGLRELDLGTKQVICRIERRVAVVILNRPEARNALTAEIKEALHAVVPRLGDDPEVGCVCSPAPEARSARVATRR
jgi:1,4-dihydroxy-2-naphthoyl-CoA synthase